MNSELARWGVGNNMLKLASFTGKHRNDSGHVATHNNCDANQGHRDTGKKVNTKKKRTCRPYV